MPLQERLAARGLGAVVALRWVVSAQVAPEVVLPRESLPTLLVGTEKGTLGAGDGRGARGGEREG